jgi:hypothetical protein
MTTHLYPMLLATPLTLSQMPPMTSPVLFLFWSLYFLFGTFSALVNYRDGDLGLSACGVIIAMFAVINIAVLFK